MPDPDRLLKTLRQAITAFHGTPGRNGSLIQLGDADEVLVAGDLHGNIANFRLLLGRAGMAQNPGRHLVLQEVIHGPFRYSSEADKSHQLVDLVAALKCQFPQRVHFLLGNHELAQLTGQWIAKGDITLNGLFRQGVVCAYGERAEQVYAAYMDLFSTLPLAVRTENRVFLSHSLPSATKMDRFDVSVLRQENTPNEERMPGGCIHSLVWGRDTRPSTVAAYLQKVDADLLVTGHIPCEQGFDVPNDMQLIIDAMGCPACFCKFRAQGPISHKELVNGVGFL